MSRMGKGEGMALFSGRRWWLAAGIIVVLGMALRLLAARGDLWLDEIWSLKLASLAGSAWGVFASVHQDNNHYLTTLWLLFTGPSALSLVYRLPALAAGAGVLVLVLLRPLRLGPGQTLIWLLLLAGSPIIVHYSSEARGYALVMFFAIAGCVALDRYLATRKLIWAALFALAALLGLLAHLTELYVLLAFVAWAVADWRLNKTGRRFAWSLLAAFAAPAVAFIALWLVDLRQLTVNGGPANNLTDVLRELMRDTLGLPRGPWELLGIVVLAGVTHELWQLARARQAEWIFLAMVIFIAPVLVIVMARPPFLLPRYFVVAMPFLLLLVARALARLANRPGWGRAAAFALLAAFLAGSGVRDARLLRDGRGNYRAAVEYMVGNTPAGEEAIASDNDFRNPMVLNYYLPRVPGASGFAYVTSADWAGRAPLWFVCHDFSADPQPWREFAGPQGRRYRLLREYPYAGLSGWHWQLYRRVDE